MKLIYSILAFTFFSFCLNGQNLAPCGTTDADIDIEYLIKNKDKLQYYKNNDAEYVIPIRFHAVANDNGIGRFSHIDIVRLVCDINTDFAPYGMKFYIYQNTVNKINNSDYYEHDFDNGYAMMNQHNVNGVVNVYMVNDPAGNCGYFAPGVDGVAVAKSCAQAGESTLTHELGHFFSLPHTFSGWENSTDIPDNQREKVARTGPTANCSYRGDTFCDTGADYVSSRWSCPYDVLVDPDGVAFTPDSSFYMSYSLDNCQSRFSEEQVASMKFNIDGQRSYLLNHNTTAAENVDIITPTIQIYPAIDDTVPTTVTLQWAEVENADYYAIYVFNALSSLQVDEFVTDNSYELENLVDGSFTFWRVIPYHLGNYCIAPPIQHRFWVSDEKFFTLADYVVQSPTCDDTFDGSITIDIDGGLDPYDLVWDDGTEGPTLNNIGKGNRSVTITDATGYTETMMIYIEGPDAIDTEIEIGLGTVTATVTGGVEPYFYNWQNTNETTETVLELPTGENELYLVDYYNCIDTTAFSLMRADVLVGNVTCTGDENGSLVIMGIEGAQSGYDIMWNDGSTATIRSGLSAGEYTLTVTDGEGNVGSETYVIQEAEQQLSLNYNQFNNNITVYPSGGQAPYETAWSHGATGTTVNNLSDGVYTVYVSDDFGCNLQFSFNVSTAVEIIGKSSVNLFLTDNNNLLNIAFGQLNEIAQMQLFDISGKLIDTYNLTANNQLNIEHLPNGVYISTITINENTHSLKWVK